MRLALMLALVLGAASPALAEESLLRRLETGDDSRGWDAVGKLVLGSKGFCTGTLVSQRLVLTAAHCLFDKETGARIDAGGIQFLAGWRNGRAAAYRGVRRAVPHPEYVYGGLDKLDRVAFDIALLELDQPIRLPSIRPFATETRPLAGDEVGVVSYAQDRSEAPSLQEVCHVLGEQPSVLVLTCSVDFGSSGSPVFSMEDGETRIVSVVSAKAEIEGREVALGTSLQEPLAALMAEMDKDDSVFRRVAPLVRSTAGTGADGQTGTGGAKFVRP